MSGTLGTFSGRALVEQPRPCLTLVRRAKMAKDTCPLPGCVRPVAALGWCEYHYRSWVRHGDVYAVKRVQGDVATRLRMNVRESPSGCLEWIGKTESNGYGRISVGGRYVWAHRASYAEFNGPILDGLHIDHLCRNPLCVNPDHLEAVTQAENNRRAHQAASPKTHCKHGHPLNEENTYQRPDGGRDCRTCVNRRSRERNQRRRAERRAS